VTQIEFHTHLDNKIQFACRLLRKAVVMNHRVGVVAPAEDLHLLDAALWTFSAHDFLPHVRVESASALSEHRITNSPVWLVEKAELLQPDQLVLYLGQKLPTGFPRFKRWIELVGQNDDEQRSARERWKHYRDRGYSLVHHDHRQQ
jgi:DNA polymerase III subunit chi